MKTNILALGFSLVIAAAGPWFVHGDETAQLSSPLSGARLLAELTSTNDPLAIRPVEVRVGTETGGKGDQLDIPITIDEKRGANGVGFSVAYDPVALTNAVVILNPDLVAAGATLIVNSSKLAQGHLGIAVALPIGTGAPSGKADLVTLQLTIGPAAIAGIYPISLTDDPVIREVVNAEANALPATWVPGSVTVRNLVPDAKDDHFDVGEHGEFQSPPGALLSNDRDLDGDALTVQNSGSFVTAKEGHVELAADGTFSYLPHAGLSLHPGENVQDEFFYVVSDGAGGTDQARVTLEIQGINDPPTADPVPPISLGEDAPQQQIPLSGIGDGDSPPRGFFLRQQITATVATDRPDLIRNLSVYIAWPFTKSGLVLFQPAAQKSGIALINVTLKDGGGTNDGGSDTFVLPIQVTVGAVNDPPTFTVSGDLVAGENFPGTLKATVTPGPVPPDETNQVVTYALSPAAVAFANVQLNPATGEVSVTAVANGNGEQVFTLTADDGQAQNNLATNTFKLTVHPVNSPPTFAMNPASLAVDEGFPGTLTAQAVPTPVPSDELGQVVAYAIEPASVPFANLTFDPQTGQLTVTSIFGAHGSQQFTVTANDGQSVNATATNTFLLTVRSVNTPPAFELSGDVTAAEDFPTPKVVTVTPGAVPPDETGQTVTYSIAPATVPFAVIAFDPTTGTTTISSVANANGTQTFTVTANDGQSAGNTVARTFVLTVTPVNDPPGFTADRDVLVDENFATTEVVQMIPGPVPGDEISQVVTYSLAPPTVAFANVAFDPATGTVTITSKAGGIGQQEFTVTANDGQATNAVATDKFLLTVNSGNRPPVFELSGDVTAAEDFPGTLLVTVTPGVVRSSETNEVVVYSMSPANVPFATVSINPATGTVSISAVANRSGTQEFTVTANDGQAINNIATDTFVLTVTPVNDPPAFTLEGGSLVSDTVTVLEDFTNTVALAVQPGPVPDDEAGQVVTYSLDPPTSAIADVQLNPATGAITIKARKDGNGQETFRVIANDGQADLAEFEVSFELVINAVNDAPVFLPIADVLEDEDFAPAKVIHVIADNPPADEAADPWTIALDPASVSFATITVDAQNHSVTIAALPNAHGSQEISVIATDGGTTNHTYIDSFLLSVRSVNDAPAFSTSGDITVPEGFSVPATLTVTPDAVPADELGQAVSYSLTPATVPFADVQLNPATGVVTFRSIPFLNGTQQFTLTANDGGNTNNIASQVFVFTVTPLNDPPAFTLSGNVTVVEDFAQEQSVTVTPGEVPGDESDQVVTYTLEPASVSFATVSLNQLTGAVSIVAVPDGNGSQLFRVIADDHESQSNTFIQEFTLTVTSVNDAPAFAIEDLVANEDFPGTLTLDPVVVPVPADELGQVVIWTLNPTNITFALLNFDSQTGRIQAAAVPDASGTQTFTLTAADGQATNALHSEQFTITVNAVNDPPVAAADTFSGPINVALEIVAPGVLGNDTDADPGDTFTITAYDTTSQLGARITLNADGSFVYDPSAIRIPRTSSPVSDYFDYTITDGQGAPDSATVEMYLIQSTYEGDVAARPSGDGLVDATDWVQAGRYLEGVDLIESEDEFRRVDTAPRAEDGNLLLGNGSITVADWVQTGRYAARLDPLTLTGGPAGPFRGIAMTNSVPHYGRSEENPVIRIDSPITSPLPAPGAMVDVAVNLISEGVTAAAGFSVEWEPLDLKFMQATLGAGSAGGSLITNLAELTMGRLGVMVSKGIGGAYEAGESAMVVLRFLVLNPEPIAFNPIRLVDSPVPKSVSDEDAQHQDAIFLDGFVLTAGGAGETDSYWAWIATFGFEDPRHFKDADPDGDGQRNYIEMLQGTDPTNPQSRLMVTSVVTLENHNRQVTWLSTPGKTYALEFATSLVNPVWRTVGVFPASPYPQTTTTGLDNQNVTPAGGVYRVRLLEAFYDYQRWISGYGLAGTDALPTSNPDGDIRDNWTEFLEGTDPTDPDSHLQIVDISGPQVTFTWSSTPSRNYIIQGTRDLNAATWSAIAIVPATAAPATQTSYALSTELLQGYNFFAVVQANPFDPYYDWVLGFGLVGPDAVTTADPDGDHLTNLEEFQRQSDPTQPDESLIITRISGAVGGGWSIGWRSRPGRDYALEFRPALDGQGVWSRLGVLRATEEESSWQDPEPNAARRFYRVVELE